MKAHLSQILSPHDKECSGNSALLRPQRRGRDGPGTTLRGTQRGILNLKLGHPPAPLASLPVLPSLSKDFQSPELFPSIFLLTQTLTHTRHHVLRSARGRGWTLLSSAANSPASRPTSAYSRDRRLPVHSPAHSPNPPGMFGGNQVLQPPAPRSHLTHRAFRAATPLPASCQPRLRAPTADEPSRSLEPGAKSRWEGWWEAEGAGPGRC